MYDRFDRWRRHVRVVTLTTEPDPQTSDATMPHPNPRVLLSWSSGKDSAWALHVLRQQPDLEVVGLLTTFNEEFDRVAMHAVRRELVEAQAAAAELPLITVMLSFGIVPKAMLVHGVRT